MGNAMRMLTAFAAVSALLLATSAPAEVVHYSAKLNGASETPPTTSKGKGSASVTLDTTKKTVSWTVSYSGLSGPATMAHFHGPAPVGKAAGVAIPLTPPLASPIKGSSAITDSQIADLKAGLWYVNVHTAANPGGEIRGQLAPSH
jgi:hypothetical protein